MAMKINKKTIAIYVAFFVQCAYLLAQASSSNTAYQILEKSRALPNKLESISLLEKNIKDANDFTPWYGLELLRMSYETGNFEKALVWGEKLVARSLPESLADQTVYWYGKALEANGLTARASALYLSRIESTFVKDPYVYLAYFGVASSGAERITVLFDKTFPDLRTTNPSIYALSRYLSGVCAVRAGDWAFSAHIFDRFLKVADIEFSKEIPWARFYVGWSQYRLGSYEKALESFSFYLDTWKNHERVYQAATAAVFCALQTDADELLFADRAVRLAPTLNDMAESTFLLASILLDRGNYTRAETELSRISSGNATTGVTPAAPRALFLLAESAFRQKKLDVASQRWATLIERFPSDSLSEEAQFRIGESWYLYGNYERSAQAFSVYKQRWPSGRFIDTVLAYGGENYTHMGSFDLSILWWEELLRKYPKATSAPSVSNSLIGVFKTKGDYSSALKAAELYKKSFPLESRIDGIDQQIAAIGALLQGISPDVHQLTTAIDQNGGVKSPEGRVIALQLSQLYLEDYTTREKAKNLLLTVTATLPKNTDSLVFRDRLTYAHSFALMGSLYREDAKYSESSTVLLTAAQLFSSIDGQRSAEALYGAADSFIQAGKRADAEKTIDTLTKTWPSSVWTRRASMLLGK